MNSKPLGDFEEFLASYLEKMEIAWWVEIVTKKPKCIYYFGPFVSSYEAQCSSGDYIKDLKQEDAQIIAVDIKRGQPKELTICEDLRKSSEKSILPSTSNFAVAWLR